MASRKIDVSPKLGNLPYRRKIKNIVAPRRSRSSLDWTRPSTRCRGRRRSLNLFSMSSGYVGNQKHTAAPRVAYTQSVTEPVNFKPDFRPIGSKIRV